MKNNELRRPEYVIEQGLQIQELQNHYDNMKIICLERFIFSLVLTVDKTLFALVSGALTGISTNVLTGFLDFTSYTPEESKLHIMQLLLALSFNCVFILFSARVIQIQDSDTSYIPPASINMKYQYLLEARYNVVYNNCMISSGYLKRTFVISVLLGVFMLLSFFCGYALLNGIEEVIEWIKCLWIRFIKM